MEDNQTTNELNSSAGAGESGASRGKATVKWGAIFGIFMIVIYFSMAYLTLFTNHFFWMVDWARYGLGTIFIVYGLWRGYRYFKNK